MYSGSDYRTFLEGTLDAFIVHDIDGRILDVNRQACVSLGYTREELLNLTVTDIEKDLDIDAARNAWAAIKLNGSALMRGQQRRKDGSCFPVQVHVSAIGHDGQTLLYALARDVSASVQAAKNSKRLTSLYRALSEINQMIVRAENAQNLFDNLCRIVVDLGGMRMAWIGTREAGGDGIVPVASCGVGVNYLNKIVLSTRADVPAGGGPTGIAFREGRPVICNDFLRDAITKPWHAKGMEFGWGASAAFPFSRDGQLFAVLNVYHELPGAFDAEMIELLEEATMDITYALDNLDNKLQRQQNLITIREQNNFLTAIFDSEPECVKVLALDGYLERMNQAGLSMLEVETLEEARTFGLIKFVAPEFQAGFLQFHQQVCAGHSGFFEFRIIGKKGTSRWLETHSTQLRNGDGDVVGHIGVTRDVTEKKTFDQRLWNQANFDQLTGLPNRHLFQERLVHELKKTHRDNAQLALIFIDLDHFKEVNDTLGHQVGDTLLVEAARRITACVRESDTVARLGGDEFMVVLPDLQGTQRVDAIVENILHALTQVFTLGANLAQSQVSASIGIALYPADGSDADQLLRSVDQAMYVAKREGRNRYSYFTSALRESAQYRHALLLDLRGALAAGQFALHFQPIIDLSNYRVFKLEALLRWHHPVRGDVGPAEFIPLAEESGLIIDIGNWVFHEAARWASRWSTLGLGNVQVAVNMSPVQLQGAATNVAACFESLKHFDIAGSCLAIEITEGLLLHASTGVSELLAQFRAAGLGLAIDDFGTGYSALSYLKKFDIDYLKIDRSFVRDLETDPSDMALSEAIIVMAHKLGLKVIAEGVETLAQCNLLQAAGCDYAQGYLFSRPVPPEQIEPLLKHIFPLGQ